jgi:hypothetical protein
MNNIDICYINPNYFSIVSEKVNLNSEKRLYLTNNEIPKDNQHLLNLSKKAKSRLSKCMGWLIYFSNEKRLKLKDYNKTAHLERNKNYGNDKIIQDQCKSITKRNKKGKKQYINYKLGFLTVTLSTPQFHSDSYIREKMLKQYLDDLRRKNLITSYIWRSEKQQNGNIHFHILIDNFVSVTYLRNRWNKIQEKEGYIDLFRKRMQLKYEKGFVFDDSIINKATKREQFRRYKKGFEENWSNPNSIDIRAIKNIKSIQGYITKYFTKETKKAENMTDEELKQHYVNCHLWGCSRNLAKLRNVWFYAADIVNGEFNKILADKTIKVLDGTYFQTYLISLSDIIKKGYYSIYNKFQQAIVEQVKPVNYQLSLI